MNCSIPVTNAMALKTLVALGWLLFYSNKVSKAIALTLTEAGAE